jgi:hypothetical protein
MPQARHRYVRQDLNLTATEIDVAPYSRRVGRRYRARSALLAKARSAWTLPD